MTLIHMSELIIFFFFLGSGWFNRNSGANVCVYIRVAFALDTLMLINWCADQLIKQIVSMKSFYINTVASLQNMRYTKDIIEILRIKCEISIYSRRFLTIEYIYIFLSNGLHKKLSELISTFYHIIFICFIWLDFCCCLLFVKNGMI